MHTEFRREAWKTLLGRRRYVLEESLKIDLKETGREGVDCVQDREQWQAVVYTVMKFGVL